MSHTDVEPVSGEELARWLGLSRKEIYDLGKAGILVRVGRAFRLEESARCYCQHLRSAAARADAEAGSPIGADLGLALSNELVSMVMECAGQCRRTSTPSGCSRDRRIRLMAGTA